MRPILLAFTAALVLTACGTSNPNDTAAPVATISIPADYTDPTQILVTASATDDVGVTRLVIQRATGDGSANNFVTLRTVTRAPFSLTYTDTLTTSGTYTYRAVAYDAAGNQGRATQEVTLTVPDPLQTLSGTVVEPGTFGYPLSTAAWTGGAGQVVLETRAAAPSEITRSPLDSGGHFTLDLTRAPADAQMQPATVNALLGENASQCSGDATSDAPQALMALTRLRVAAGKSGVAAPFTFLPPLQVGGLSNTQLSLSGLIYTNRIVTFKGALTCSFAGKPPLGVGLSLGLDKGWHKITAQTTTDSAGHLTNIVWSTSPEFPAEVGNHWVLLPQTIQVTP